MVDEFLQNQQSSCKYFMFKYFMFVTHFSILAFEIITNSTSFLGYAALHRCTYGMLSSPILLNLRGKPIQQVQSSFGIVGTLGI